MKVKELLELLQEFKDDDLTVKVEFLGFSGMELDFGDVFKVDDININDKSVCLEIRSR